MRISTSVTRARKTPLRQSLIPRCKNTSPAVVCGSSPQCGRQARIAPPHGSAPSRPFVRFVTALGEPGTMEPRASELELQISRVSQFAGRCLAEIRTGLASARICSWFCFTCIGHRLLFAALRLVPYIRHKSGRLQRCTTSQVGAERPAQMFKRPRSNAAPCDHACCAREGTM